MSGAIAESALVVYVPEAEPYVREMRARLDPTAALGVPAHITVLYPFKDPEKISEEVLRDVRMVLSSVPSFAYRLARLGRFPAALYLAPEPVEPFVALTRRIIDRFPDHAPYGGRYAGIVPHLTVAQASEAEHDQVEAELRTTLATRGAIDAICADVMLLENSSGRWKAMYGFPLFSHEGGL